MKRHTLIRFAAVASAALLTAGTVTACSSSGGGDNGSESKTLNVTLANHVWTEAIKKKIPEFEKQSGLKVTLTQLSEDQLADSYKVKLNAGSSDVDVMMYRPL